MQRLRSHAGFVQETGNCRQPAFHLQGWFGLASQRLVPFPLRLACHSFATSAWLLPSGGTESSAAQDCPRMPRYSQKSSSA